MQSNEEDTKYNFYATIDQQVIQTTYSFQFLSIRHREKSRLWNRPLGSSARSPPAGKTPKCASELRIHEQLPCSLHHLSNNGSALIQATDILSNKCLRYITFCKRTGNGFFRVRNPHAFVPAVELVFCVVDTKFLFWWMCGKSVEVSKMYK